MNKQFVFLILAFSLLLLIVPQSSAYFTKSHELWTLSSLSSVDSPITNLCQDYKTNVVDGNTGADTFVIFYFSSNKQVSYIFSHQAGAGLDSCIERAGNDPEKLCTCYGIGSHIVQDYYSHNAPGLVPKYLRKFGGLNFIGHMTIENDYMNKHLEYRKNDPIVASGELDLYDSKALDSFFSEYGGNDELRQLFTEVAGVNVDNTFRIFRSGYQGEGFYNTVYKDKVSLPSIGWWISIALVLIGILLPIILLFGSTKWKWLGIAFFLIFLAIGSLLIISFLTGTTWKITTFLIEQPVRIGYLSVTQTDIKNYDEIVQAATDEFFRTGRLPVEDASGLSYIDNEGSSVEGELIKSQAIAAYVLFPVTLLIFAIMTLYLFLKAFGVKLYRWIDIVGGTITIATSVIIGLALIFILSGLLF